MNDATIRWIEDGIVLIDWSSGSRFRWYLSLNCEEMRWFLKRFTYDPISNYCRYNGVTASNASMQVRARATAVVKISASSWCRVACLCWFERARFDFARLAVAQELAQRQHQPAHSSTQTAVSGIESSGVCTLTTSETSRPAGARGWRAKIYAAQS